ncbi:mCG1034925, isoform CRA_a [Mus musculus]|nr:mCG1034925, isoform CRA_a [Mus musculus]
MVGIWNPLSQPVIHKQVHGSSAGFPRRSSRTGLLSSWRTPQSYLESPTPEWRDGEGKLTLAHSSRLYMQEKETLKEKASLGWMTNLHKINQQQQ